MTLEKNFSFEEGFNYLSHNQRVERVSVYQKGIIERSHGLLHSKLDVLLIRNGHLPERIKTATGKLWVSAKPLEIYTATELLNFLLSDHEGLNLLNFMTVEHCKTMKDRISFRVTSLIISFGKVREQLKGGHIWDNNSNIQSFYENYRKTKFFYFMKIELLTREEILNFLSLIV
ncbi:hypothetical protein K501DRAFT_271204 [Backusella circina FSU 941]|nr:hypothetical protein K501DRAFT_271204 [Backusella circina FSU 941]